MDFTRLAVDAGAFINRAVQYTEETLGQAEKTELDGSLEDLLAKADVIKTRTDQIISQTEVLLQPNPGARMENLLYEHLDWSAPPRPCPHEVLGETMSQAGLELGSNAPYGTALLKCGEAQRQFGSAERKFIQSTAIHFLSPLRSYTEGEYRDIQNERKLLVNKRLDLDIAKTRLRKAHEADREARNLNANPLGDDYVVYASYMFSFLRVKWLKMWAQEISQAEMELRICQSLFDRQAEVTKRLLEGISNTHHPSCVLFQQLAVGTQSEPGNQPWKRSANSSQPDSQPHSHRGDQPAVRHEPGCQPNPKQSPCLHTSTMGNSNNQPGDQPALVNQPAISNET
ncbi:endophilin-B1-like isoform X2 [Osmerus mordax]|uniref:endophilin-B1-like isoform X2 n=1 Tax=Osmerus mordax TaxID=8014 RepID=UPI00350F3872